MNEQPEFSESRMLKKKKEYYYKKKKKCNFNYILFIHQLYRAIHHNSYALT